MAEIPVTQKRSSNWWIWLVALLALAALVWFLFGMFDDDRAATAASPAAPASVSQAPLSPAAPGVTAATAPSTATAPPAVQAGAEPAAAAVPAAPASEVITTTGAYASTGDKLSLVGRRAELTDAKVSRVVGPKTFTVVSGAEEMFVIVGDDLSKGVGSQGQIDKGSVLNVKGSFRRLTAEEISDVSDNRFRDLTSQERETLRSRQVYLHATEFSKIS